MAILALCFGILSPRSVSAGTVHSPLARHPAASTASTQHRGSRFVDEGTLVLVTDGSAADIDPASDELAASNMVQRNIDDTLVAMAGSRIDRVVPQLATSWKVEKGGTVYIFYLRHGVKFHTGRTMTAADVKYSLVRTVAAGLTNSYLLSRFMSNPQKQIKVLNRYTIEFDLKRPQQFFLLALADEYICSILDSRALQAHQKNHDWGHAWATDHDVGTGPYRIQSWVRSQQIVLTRFPGYWGGWSGPHFSKIIIRTVPESTTRRELLERGQADLTFNLTPADNAALRQNPHVRVVANYGASITYVVMTEAGPLASPYARQAMSYAFDYAAYIKYLHGFARRAYGIIPRDLLGYNPHLFHYQTNLSKARLLLQKAGVKPGTTLTYMSYPNPAEVTAGEILQAQLAQIGITVKLQQVDEATYNGVFYGNEPASRRPNFMPFAWWPDFDDPYDMALPLVASWEGGAAGANAGFYHNKRVDALLKQMANANHKLLIKDAYELQDITTRQDPPAIWAANEAQVTVMNRNLKGYVFNPLELQTYEFYDLHR
jgi:peptide/nickel transport system substrate-binding protein